MSQKRIWIGRLRHTRQIENHHKKDQILVYPEGDYILHSEVLSPTVSTHFLSNIIFLGDLLNKLPPSQSSILAKSGRIGHASFTSETENVHSAFAPR